jgi:hypothetical protein
VVSYSAKSMELEKYPNNITTNRHLDVLCMSIAISSVGEQWPIPESQKPRNGTSTIRHGSKMDHIGGFRSLVGDSDSRDSVYDQMKSEHWEFASVTFTSNNYGIVTNSKEEWDKVVNGDPTFEDGVTYAGGATTRRRIPSSWWAEDEDAIDNTCERRRLQVRHRDVDDAGERSRKVIAELAAQHGLSVDEAIAIIMYTGPMYRVYNCLLEKYTEQDYERFRGGFKTTIAVIVGALEKLSRNSSAQTVYRGSGGWGRLPDCFWTPADNDDAERGFTLLGFASSTSDINVALRYSGAAEGRPHPSVIRLEPRPGERLKCATVQHMSQFPGEIECIFPPCCFLEPFSPNHIIYQTFDSVLVPVVSARIIVRFDSQPIRGTNHQDALAMRESELEIPHTPPDQPDIGQSSEIIQSTSDDMQSSEMMQSSVPGENEAPNMLEQRENRAMVVGDSESIIDTHVSESTDLVRSLMAGTARIFFSNAWRAAGVENATKSGSNALWTAATKKQGRSSGCTVLMALSRVDNSTLVIERHADGPALTSAMSALFRVRCSPASTGRALAKARAARGPVIVQFAQRHSAQAGIAKAARS